MILHESLEVSFLTSEDLDGFLKICGTSRRDVVRCRTELLTVGKKPEILVLPNINAKLYGMEIVFDNVPSMRVLTKGEDMCNEAAAIPQKSTTAKVFVSGKQMTNHKDIANALDNGKTLMLNNTGGSLTRLNSAGCMETSKDKGQSWRPDVWRFDTPKNWFVAEEQREIYVNIYDDGSMHLHQSLIDAQSNRAPEGKTKKFIEVL